MYIVQWQLQPLVVELKIPSYTHFCIPTREKCLCTHTEISHVDLKLKATCGHIWNPCDFGHLRFNYLWASACELPHVSLHMWAFTCTCEHMWITITCEQQSRGQLSYVNNNLMWTTITCEQQSSVNTNHMWTSITCEQQSHVNNNHSAFFTALVFYWLVTREKKLIYRMQLMRTIAKKKEE